ncbi:hypothetical protein [Burkholderia vietnamiensis]|uniref:hypothetical protein n=1 Tax=Burkholderia vietnamiensis TaxID=60552 RepID=UPI001CF274D0|nr:hypothetical protein [Burkholderia vietnamiensis]MCA8270359.1 hypothetical protein [Burkholderia vietnamiensis]
MKRGYILDLIQGLGFLGAGVGLAHPFVKVLAGRAGALAVIAGLVAAMPFAGVRLRDLLERHPAVLRTAAESRQPVRDIASLAVCLILAIVSAVCWGAMLL